MAVKIQGVSVITDLRELRNLSDGTSSTPSITFGSDNDTGIFHPSANRVAISTGGNIRLDVNSSTVILPTADINGGTVDSTIIGASTPAAGSFTTLTTTGAVTAASVTSSGVINSTSDLRINGASVVDTALAFAIALG